MEKSGLEEVCQGKDEVVKTKEKNNEATRQLLEAKSQQLSQLESALGDKDRELASVRERCTSLLVTQIQNQALKVYKGFSLLLFLSLFHVLQTQEKVNAGVLSLKEAEIAAITKEMEGKNKLLQSKMKVIMLKSFRRLSWMLYIIGG